MKHETHSLRLSSLVETHVLWSEQAVLSAARRLALEVVMIIIGHVGEVARLLAI